MDLKLVLFVIAVVISTASCGYRSGRSGRGSPCTIPKGAQYQRSRYYLVRHDERLKYGNTSAVFDGNWNFLPGVKVFDRERIRVACNKDIQGDAIHKSVIRTCSSGHWSPRLPFCSVQRVDVPHHAACPPLQVAIPRAHAPDSSKQTFRHNYVLEFTCEEKYTLKGDNSVMCKNGNWTKPDFECVADLGCQAPVVPGAIITSEKRSYPNGYMLEYTCGTGFYTTGTGYFICKDGRWSGEDNACRSDTDHDDVNDTDYPSYNSPDYATDYINTSDVEDSNNGTGEEYGNSTDTSNASDVKDSNNGTGEEDGNTTANSGVADVKDSNNGTGEDFGNGTATSNASDVKVERSCPRRSLPKRRHSPEQKTYASGSKVKVKTIKRRGMCRILTCSDGRWERDKLVMKCNWNRAFIDSYNGTVEQHGNDTANSGVADFKDSNNGTGEEYSNSANTSHAPDVKDFNNGTKEEDSNSTNTSHAPDVKDFNNGTKEENGNNTNTSHAPDVKDFNNGTKEEYGNSTNTSHAPDVKDSGKRGCASAFAQSVGTRFQHGTTLTYACNGETVPEGNGTVVCNDGVWETTNFTCRDSGPRDCEYLDVPNALSDGGEGPRFPHGSTLTYACNGARVIEGNSTVVCNDSVWETFNFTCRDAAPRDCDYLDVPNAVALSDGEEGPGFPHGTTLTYACNGNRVLEGNSTVLCNDGVWENTNFTCRVYHGCNSSSFPNQSSLDLKVSDVTLVRDGFNLTLTCEKGEQMRGDPSVTCNDGIWSRATFKCIKIKRSCPRIPISKERIDPVEPEYTSGSKVKVKCMTGLNMFRTLTCRNGQWKGQNAKWCTKHGYIVGR